MKLPGRRGLAFAGFVSLVLTAAASAQTPPAAPVPPPARRPYRALFGSDGRSGESQHNVDFSLGLTAATDNGYATTVQTEGPNGPAVEGRYEFQEFYSAGGSLSYDRRGRDVQFGAAGTASYPYYPQFAQSSALAYSGSVSTSYAPGRSSISASARYAFSPYYNFGLAGGGGPFTGAFDYASAFTDNKTATAGATFSHRFNRVTSMSAGYSASGLVFVTDQRSSSSQTVHLSANRELSRSTSLTLGYSFLRTRADAGLAASVLRESGSHGGDVGFSYTQRSSRGAGVGITASMGVSRLDIPGTTTGSQDLRWRGSVGVTKPLGNGWSLGGSYSRSLQFVPGLSDMVWGDSASVRAGGLINRRVSLAFGAAYSNGAAVSYGSSQFDTYSGSASVQYSLTASSAVNVSYIYYRYQFPPGYELPTGMPPLLSRQRVQVGLSFWMPLVRAGQAPPPRARIN